MNGTGKEVYQMPEGDWAFACCGIISDGFATKKEAELAAEVERLRERWDTLRGWLEHDKAYGQGHKVSRSLLLMDELTSRKDTP